jgi:hypothetical protein
MAVIAPHRAFDVAVLLMWLLLCCAFDVPPVWLRRASQDKVEQPRADAGEAGMPKRF